MNINKNININEDKYVNIKKKKNTGIINSKMNSTSSQDYRFLFF